jgi:peptide-methionine (S)-S-oxide reductase
MPPYPAGTETASFALGCFWGAERRFFERDGVRVTAVGYQGGVTPNPTYEEVCSGRTGHAESVLVVFDPAVVSYDELVRYFFESHNPTQGNRQGNDVGTQYRSVIFVTSDVQKKVAEDVLAIYNEELARQKFGPITTTIEDATPFYMAEEYHQQYLVANPNGYCGLGGTGVSCPVGLS